MIEASGSCQFSNDLLFTSRNGERILKNSDLFPSQLQTLDIALDSLPKRSDRLGLSLECHSAPCSEGGADNQVLLSAQVFESVHDRNQNQGSFCALHSCWGLYFSHCPYGLMRLRIWSEFHGIGSIVLGPFPATALDRIGSHAETCCRPTNINARLVPSRDPEAACVPSMAYRSFPYQY